MKNIIIFIIFFFGQFNTSIALERNVQLDKLFKELKNINTNLVLQTEQKIWKIWSTHPTNNKLTTRLEEGSQFVRDQNYLKAIDVFTEVINLDKKWAEAWNKRATVFYLIGEFQDSQNDIDKVLELEKRHFGALAGQGLVNIQLKNYEKAIRSYQQAQEIYPTMKSATIMIKHIEELIKEQTI